MFSLLITLISIGLAVALALATMFYGGEIMRNAKIRAKASTLVAQGGQILSAAQGFRAQYLRWPTDIAELLAYKYLTDVPMAPVSLAPSFPLVSPAYAASESLAWTTAMAGAPFYWLQASASTNLCREINYLARGDNGIYRAARPTLQTQCFGENEKYHVVVGFAQTVEEMQDALKQADPDIVTQEDGGGWAVEPTLTSGEGFPLSTSVVDFGTVTAGSSAAASVTLTNRSSKMVTLSQISGLPAQVTLDQTGTAACKVGAALKPQTSCNLSLLYKPTTPDPFSATVVLNSDYPDRPLLDFNVKGESTIEPASDASPVMVLPLSGQPLYDVAGDGTLYVRKTGAGNTVERYTPAGSLNLTRTLSTASLTACTSSAKGWVLYDLAVDGSGNVHAAFNCQQYNNTRMSYLIRYSPDLVQQAVRLVDGSSEFIKSLTSNKSGYVGMELEGAVQAYNGSMTYMHKASRVTADYATKDASQYNAYQTTTSWNGACYGGAYAMGMNGGFTAVLIECSNTYSTYNFGGGFVASSSVKYGIYGPMAVSPLTGHAYGADASKLVTTNTAYLVRATNPVRDSKGNLVAPVLSSGPYIQGTRIDNAGCLYTFRKLPDGSQGITKTKACGY